MSAGSYAVVERTSTQYEIWEKCSDSLCITYHRLVASSTSRFDAERVVQALEAWWLKTLDSNLPTALNQEVTAAGTAPE